MAVLSIKITQQEKEKLRKKFGFMSRPFQELVKPLLEDRVIVLTDPVVFKKLAKLAKKENRTVGAQATVLLRRLQNGKM